MSLIILDGQVAHAVSKQRMGSDDVDQSGDLPPQDGGSKAVMPVVHIIQLVTPTPSACN